MLALAYHFAPAPNSASIRNTKILKHVPRFGVHLDLLTVRTEDLGTGQNEALLQQVPADINVVRTRCLYPQRWIIGLKNRPGASAGTEAKGSVSAQRSRRRRGSVWQRVKDMVTYAMIIPDKYVGWLPFALWAGFLQMRKGRSEVIYAVGQPWTAFFVGYLLKLVFNRPLVIDFMDPWASRSREWDDDRPEVLNSIAIRLERFVIRRADFVIANTEELAADFKRRLPLPADKVGVVTCGFDPDDLRDLPERRPGDVFVITHTGTCYGSRNPVNLLKAVKMLIDDGRIPPDTIRVNFIGKMSIKEPELDAVLADPVLKKVVHLESWVPHAAALQFLAQSDVLLLLQPDLQLVVPAKLYEYAAIGRPILALAELDGAVARVVRDERLGATVHNDDVRGIARELERLYGAFRQLGLKPTYDADDVADYSVEKLAAKLSDILHSVRRQRAERQVG